MNCIDLTSKQSKCWATLQNIQNKPKLQKWSKSNDLHRFDVKTIEMLRYCRKRFKTTNRGILQKWSNYNTWIASIWRQNDQNVELRRKTFKTKLNYKSDQNPMTCIDLTSKLSKCWGTSQNIQNKAKLQNWSNYPMTCIDLMSKRSKNAKLQKQSNYDKFASIWRQNYQNVEVLRKTFKTKLNYKSDQNPMSCIDLTSKRSKCWVTSQNIQKKAKLQKWSKSNDLHRFDVKTIKMLRYFAKHSKQRKTTKLIKITNELHRFDVKTIKTFKTKLNYKSDQNPMSCIDLTSKRSKCWVTSQNIQNKAKLQKWSKSNDLHRFDVKTIKTFKTKLNYKSDQNPMSCIDLTSKRSKCWVTSQNIQNKAKLQKWSKSNDLHRFDVKTIKTFKTKLNYKSDQNPMSSIDLTSKRSKCWVTSQNIQNKAKLQKWSKSNDLHRFDVKTIKTFKTKLNYKSDQNPMSCIDLTSKRSKCWVTSQNIQNKAKLQKW